MLQLRVGLDGDAANEYAGRFRRGETAPPLDMFRYSDGGLWLVHGFHRLEGAERAGVEELDVVIHEGDRAAAFRFAAAANRSQNAVRWTDADAYKAAEALLRDGGCWDWSNRRIAEHCGSTHPTVGKIRARILRERQVAEGVERVSRAPEQREGRDGRKVAVRTAEDRLGARVAELKPLRRRLERLADQGVRRITNGKGDAWDLRALLVDDELDRIRLETLDRILAATEIHEAYQASMPARHELRARLERLRAAGVARVSATGDSADAEPVDQLLEDLDLIAVQALPALRAGVELVEAAQAAGAEDLEAAAGVEDLEAAAGVEDLGAEDLEAAGAEDLEAEDLEAEDLEAAGAEDLEAEDLEAAGAEDLEAEDPEAVAGAEDLEAAGAEDLEAAGAEDLEAAGARAAVHNLRPNHLREAWEHAIGCERCFSRLMDTLAMLVDTDSCPHDPRHRHTG